MLSGLTRLVKPTSRHGPVPDLTIAAHDDIYVAEIVFVPNGQSLASSSNDGTARLWNTNTGNLNRVLKGNAGSIWCLAFSPDGNRIACGHKDGTVTIWDVSTGKLALRFTADQCEMTALAFSPDGQLLACSGGWTTGKGALFETTNFVRVRELDKSSCVTSFAFSADGTTLAGGDLEGDVGIWDVATGKRLRHARVAHYAIKSISILPSTRSVMTCSYDGLKVRSSDLKKVELAVAPPSTGGCSVAAVTSNGQLVAISNRLDDVPGPGEGEIELWDLKSRVRLGTIGRQRHHYSSLAFSPDDAWLAAGDYSGTISIWKLSRIFRN